MINKWRRGLTLSLILGFILSSLVIISFLLFIPKYNAAIIEEINIDSDCSVYFVDLNNDGNSEKVNYYIQNLNSKIYLYNNQDAFISTWLFNDIPVKNSELIFNDYNNDSITEIFSLHQCNDSLFLYGIKHLTENDFFVNREYLAEFNASSLVTNEIIDVNTDGYNDLFIVLRSDIQPFISKIVAYDIQHKKLLLSKSYNSSISEALVRDIDNNGKNEYYIACKSKNIDGNGTQAGLTVLDNNFNNICNPMCFVGKPSCVTLNPFIIDGKPRLAVLHTGSDSGKIFNKLMIFDFYGKKLNEISLANNKNLSIISSDKLIDEILLYSGNKIMRINKNLKIEKEIDLNNNEYSFITIDEINKNNKPDLLFKNNKEILIIADNLNQKIKLKTKNEGVPVYSVKKSESKINQVNLKIGNKNYLIELFNKNEYLNRYVLYILIYISITFIVFVIMNLLFKLRRSKQLAQFIEKEDKDNFINKLDVKLGEKITGLRNKVLEIKQDDDSYKEVVEQINDTYIELKNISEEISRENSRGIYIHDFFNNLADRSSVNKVKINLYPNDEWYEISTDLQNHLFKLIDDTLNHISDLIRNVNINVQLTRHLNYINCIIEIEDSFIDVLNHKNEKYIAIDSRLLLINGKYETDGTQGKGTIINYIIPLNANFSGKKGNQKIKIIIAEDHDVSLFGLISLFKTKDDIEVIGTAKNGMEVLKILEEKTPDIVITDISMPGMDGIELSEKLKNDFPDIKVIVFTMYMENWFIEQLTQNGARGFVSKNSRIIELVEAVRQVAQGNYYYCHQFKSKFGTNGANGYDSQKSMLDSLTTKELQIVECYANNLKRKEIAAKFYVHQNTIDTYIANIMLKLNAGDEDEIIRIAKRQKFVDE
ncbi:MAG: hypothetical protein A2X13_13820 [Bacteroidetes bacterium GWC2_33_15]|nr:MAG: hypothetical protein A2X10_09035 [Bacteroidetes bacterium GWA2_33_15]OFX50424.1 MAG: hypothetical protein A2X13_13820 [Bacteroidetes bacterium GWC2_33_15]OFX66658.1 MAG: hypothetical protein A2X15_08055 [Bacteroidetes bacterium GWB2_32_14]OFX69276.1 MAG: hypothetical protein A2X14_08985 [Bacteroidetes bacterium GWD2_33_33]HAN18591.1 hypothetical protein [Bacteroidales bacterium]